MAVISTVQVFAYSPGTLAATGVVILENPLTRPSKVLLYLCGQAIYNVFFHPLRSFPGPTSYAMSRIPYLNKLFRGTLELYMLDLHKKYGDVVRIAPNELAISRPEAWKEIMGNRARGEEEFGKWMPFYRAIEDKDPISIINADRELHGRLRRQLSHGFSDKSMREQEPLIKQYIDALLKRMHGVCAGGSNPLDLVEWYNFATFDIIGDLAFGESFGCIENAYFHPFVKRMLNTGKIGMFLQSASHFPLFKKFLVSLIPLSTLEEQMKVAREKLVRRMEMGKERPDLIEGLLKKKDEWNLSLGELVSNSQLLLIGGSETTATLLSGVTYLLLTNPHALERLTAEVRSAFKSEDEITINTVNGLGYMLACLDEALRMYPPVPTGLPRVIPKGGARIAGQFIPEDTIVAIHQWATYHNEKHFTDPFAYHPERFLGDPKFANDRREALQPFHVGPRNCLGRNLAYTEMRLILARLIYNFDMKLAPECADWMRKQRVFLFWTKGALKVHLTSVRR
ncbi:hypothetical protein AJ79_07931 [Helicocarpus griseus UAMH5409]|uniref:Cytochrome P450 monooxygenase n=1 Tax=Helicocarpus griseus UAMH5409 TaxID=1447875 RepID=A0A2B7WXS4_9EURO|nr:hypothetical protein AJ79_07931 [Helicocarpus griseus UAMH5409]